MSMRVAILGASGYVGGELLRLIATHPQFECVIASGASSARKPFEALHPHLALAYPGRCFEAYEPDLLDGCDLVMAALPHGHSQRVVDDIIKRDLPLVDLGADFRLDNAAQYRRWYGETHSRPELLGSFVYGLPEFARHAIAGSRRVAAPGCYPTAASLALKPLIDAGLIAREGIIVDAASGVSGAGRAASAATQYCAVEGNFRAYGLLGHRHTAEMEMMLGGEVLFTPHLVPISRAILATCYAQAVGPCDPLEILREAYRGERFVHVGDTPPETKWAAGSNAAFVSARYDDRTKRVIAIAAIDNLGKGAAGQMIQCANLMLGLDEHAGLANMGIYP